MELIICFRDEETFNNGDDVMVLPGERGVQLGF